MPIAKPPGNHPTHAPQTAPWDDQPWAAEFEDVLHTITQLPHETFVEVEAFERQLQDTGSYPHWPDVWNEVSNRLGSAMYSACVHHLWQRAGGGASTRSAVMRTMLALLDDPQSIGVLRSTPEQCLTLARMGNQHAILMLSSVILLNNVYNRPITRSWP